MSGRPTRSTVDIPAFLFATLYSSGARSLLARLTPMDLVDYAAFLEQAIVDYADDKVRVGNWQPDEAIERSRGEFANLLPQGKATPNNHLWTIEEGETATKVGILWLVV